MAGRSWLSSIGDTRVDGRILAGCTDISLARRNLLSPKTFLVKSRLFAAGKVTVKTRKWLQTWRLDAG